MSTKRRLRRSFSSEEKTTILRRHLADKVSVADLADEYHIQPAPRIGDPGAAPEAC